MRSMRTCFLSAIMCVLGGTLAFSQMPQDNWYQVGIWGRNGSSDGQFSSPYGVAVDTNGLVYVADTVNCRIQVFQSDATFLRKWGNSGSDDGQFNYPHGIALGTTGLVYVADSDNERIQVFQQDGTFVCKWGSSGSDDGQFSHPWGITVDTNGLIYVADLYNSRIQVFQSDGTFVRKWGTTGSGDGQFNLPRSVAAGTDGLIYVADTDNYRIQVFRSDGTFVRKWGGVFNQPCGIASGATGMVYVADTVNCRIQVFRSDGTFVGRWGSFGTGYGQFINPHGITVSASGLVYVAEQANNRIQVFHRGYRTPAVGIPDPYVTSVTQRVGVAYVDIDYTVWDSDSTNVQVAALGLSNGVVSLDNIVLLNTLLEGTSNSIGTNITANVQHRITWDAGADWKVGWGNIKFEILANDGRPMVDFHFITIPSNGPDPELEIERFPMREADFQHCWYWLVATRDAAISFKTNKVYGVSGTYTDKLLAQSSGTTADGRSFLFERLNVRAATTAEVNRVRAGTGSVTNQWTPRYPTDRRSKYNEFGFDSAYTQGAGVWYVVPLP